MRRICYVTGTRADFGLMSRTLTLADSEDSIDLSVCVIGTHFSEEFGNTIQDIEASKLRICARIPTRNVYMTSGGAMARALGKELVAMVSVFEEERPDFVLLLGDRGEMLAAALAALHLNIAIAHIHGGERSGTVDEPVRHAISKLAHYHFVATKGARERLIRMGEYPEKVFVTGAPGLDGLKEMVCRSRVELCSELDFSPSLPLALVIFHPVLQEENQAGLQIREIMKAAFEQDLQVLCQMPNSDAGGEYIRDVLREYSTNQQVRIVTHFKREDFISWMAAVDLMIGNSSAAIIEAASLGLPVVNVGSRQNERERSGNTIDVSPNVNAISQAIKKSLAWFPRQWENVYGDGRAAEKIVELLISLPITQELLVKINAY